MANVPIEEQLGFDISAALQGISQIDDALTQVVTSFQVGLASALETLTSAGANITPLAETLDVAGLGPAVDTALTDALAAPLPPVMVEADTAPLTDAIDTATAVTPVVPIAGDTTEATTAIDALAVTPVDVTVTADTSEAQTAIDDLGAAATTAAGGSGGAGGVGSLSTALEGLSTITPIASGETGGLVDRIAGLSPATAAAGAGLVAVGAFIGDVTHLAADAEAQQKRFNEVFGQSAQAVQNISVGGLTISLKELGIQSATSSTALQSSASHIGELGKSSGASAQQIVSTTDGLLALAGAAAVTNPHLGDTATVTDRLSKLLQTGGPRLSAFGISLTAAQIGAEGVSLGLAATAKELTPFDRLVAGTTLALQQSGDTLGTKFAAGAANAQIQLRSLTVQLEETLAAVGGPLLQPVTDSLKSLVPVAQEVGVTLGNLAQIIVPAFGLVASGLTLLNAPLGLVADGLGLIASGGVPVAIGIGVVGAAALAAQLPFYGLVAASEALGVALTFATGPIGITIAALAAIGLAAKLAGDDAKTAAVDTSALDAAFQSTTGSAASTSGALDGVNKAIEDYLGKALAAGKAGNTAADAAEKLGLSNRDLARALSGSDTQFEKLLTTIDSSIGKNESVTSANSRLFDILQTGRDTIEANAQASLTLAVNTGLVAKSTVDSAAAHHVAAIALNEDGTAATDFLAVLRDLAPAIDAATKQTNDQAQAATASSPAYAQLVQQFATGSITLDTFTNSLDKFGFVGSGAKDQAKAVSDALNALTNAAAGALPTVGGAIDAFAATVKSDFQKVATDVHTGSWNVVADLKTLADDQDPARFAANLDAQTANVLSFTLNLARLVNEGFGTLAASLAQKGPEVAGGLAAALASDPAKARTAQGAEELSKAAADQLDVFLRSHFPQLQGLGVAAANQITQGAAGVIASDGSIETSILTLNPKVAAAFKPDVKGSAVTAVNAAAATIPTLLNVVGASGSLGNQAGLAFSLGMGSGIAQGISSIQIAATGAALSARDAANRALGIKSPSAVGAEIGRQFVVGIAQGIGDLSPLQRATAALTLALAPGIATGSSGSPARLAGGSTPTPGASAGVLGARRVESTIILNKTDPDPKLFADELAWMLQ